MRTINLDNILNSPARSHGRVAHKQAIEGTAANPSLESAPQEAVDVVCWSITLLTQSIRHTAKSAGHIVSLEIQGVVQIEYNRPLHFHSGCSVNRSW